jgi:hypothetical protein
LASFSALFRSKNFNNGNCRYCHFLFRKRGQNQNRDPPSVWEACKFQGIQVKFLCFFEAVHELFMNVQMLFKFHGNIQIFLIIFELVLEVFMNCSNFLNCS